MSSSKKDKKGVKIYKDLKFQNSGLKSVLLPFKGSDKIPDEEWIVKEVPKWCEPGDPLYEFFSEQIKKRYGNGGVIFCPYVPSVFTKDPEKEEN